jgi:hypothetical protein
MTARRLYLEVVRQVFQVRFNFYSRAVRWEIPMPLEPPSVPLWLDLANERLWCGDQARALRPKTFALLRYLMAHPGQVLPKAVLLEPSGRRQW